ncbi:mitochondrial peripheral inner membrane protein [Exophiala oligosperma]
MFARCSTRAPSNLNHAITAQPPALRIVTRFKSTTPEGTQSPDPQSRPPKSRLSKRSVFVAAWTALGVVAGWQIYNYNKSRRDSFVAYTLVSKEPVSSTASIFHLEPKQAYSSFGLYKDAWRKGIWNVDFKQPQLQIVRAYTPLPPVDVAATGPGSEGGKEEKKDELRFLIRKDPHGEVSSYLHKLPVGAEIEMRGPNLEYELTPDVRQIVFFAGGTGIAPALQVAHALFEGHKDSTASDSNSDSVGRGSTTKSLHILWASRMREDCVGGVSDPPPASEAVMPPKPTWSGFFSSRPKPRATSSPTQSSGTDKRVAIVEELDALKRKYPGQVTVEYFVNAEDTWIDEDAVFRALSRFDDKEFSKGSTASAASGHGPRQRERQILISGPPGFISYLAGPKEWRNGREEQGPVSRIIAHAIAKNPHDVTVWKI